jgi:hypothetical protein
MVRSVLVLLSLATACQDYNLTPDIDPNRPRDDDSGDIDPNDDTDIAALSCDSQELAGFEGAIDEACVAEVQSGTFNPVVEWTKPSWSCSSPTTTATERSPSTTSPTSSS